LFFYFFVLFLWVFFSFFFRSLTPRFTQSCNTPFSGLAADGAKLALWNLTHVGFRVVAFVHDEIVLEIPENGDHDRDIALINEVEWKESLGL
jgi:hypothetical protein